VGGYKRAKAIALVLTTALIVAFFTTPASADSQSGTPVEGGKLTGVPASSYDPNRVIVRMQSHASTTAVNKLLKTHKMVQARHFNSANVSVYNITSNENPVSLVNKLRSDPNVALAEPDYIIKPSALTNDTNISQFWGLKNSGQNIQGTNGIAGIDADVEQAWSTSTGQGVLVGVLDEGIDINHPELVGHIWTGSDCYNDGIDHDHDGYVNDCHGWDFYHNDNSVFDAADGDDHGTHVAGTIAATANNSLGGAGVAPNVTIMPLKFLGPNGGLTSDAISAIQFAKDHGVRIVNCSWGGSGYSQALKDAMANSGMLFAVAAGNNSADLSSSPTYPASFDLPNEIVVAAVDNRGNLASFSNRGGDTSLGAPGVNIYSTIPKAATATIAVNRSTSTYKSAFWGFGLEAVTGAASRRDLLRNQLTQLGANLTSPIELVDDDESNSNSAATPDTASMYTDALAAAGFTNVHVTEVTPDQSGPTAAALNGRFVIWETGYAVGSQR
jgi:subtilisin family serine protease